jgi:hypothetical protein
MSKKICKENSLLRQWRSQVSASGNIPQTTLRSNAGGIFSANEIQLPHESSLAVFRTDATEQTGGRREARSAIADFICARAHQKTWAAFTRELQVISILSYHNTKAAGFRFRF